MSSEHVTLQPLHTPDGKVYAYVVPAKEFEKLRQEVETLRLNVARLRDTVEGIDVPVVCTELRANDR